MWLLNFKSKTISIINSFIHKRKQNEDILFSRLLKYGHWKVLPSVTFESQDFGRHFLLDANMEFLSAPSFKSGGYDESQIGYVEEWTDWEGVDMAKIFGIYRTMAAQFHYDEILRLKGIGV